MINLSGENLLSLREASKILPGRPHISTLHRWRRGIRGAKLETVRVGGRVFTSYEALDRFAAASTAAAAGEATQCQPTRQRDRAAEAEKELAREGF